MLLAAGILVPQVLAGEAEDSIMSLQQELREFRTQILGRIEKIEAAIAAANLDVRGHGRTCNNEAIETEAMNDALATAADTISGRLECVERILKDFTAG